MKSQMHALGDIACPLGLTEETVVRAGGVGEGSMEKVRFLIWPCKSQDLEKLEEKRPKSLPAGMSLPGLGKCDSRATKTESTWHNGILQIS